MLSARQLFATGDDAFASLDACGEREAKRPRLSAEPEPAAELAIEAAEATAACEPREFSAFETQRLLGLLAALLPVSRREWAALAREFNATPGVCARPLEALERQLSAAAGGLGTSAVVGQARAIRGRLADKASMGDGEDIKEYVVGMFCDEEGEDGRPAAVVQQAKLVGRLLARKAAIVGGRDVKAFVRRLLEEEASRDAGAAGTHKARDQLQLHKGQSDGERSLHAIVRSLETQLEQERAERAHERAERDRERRQWLEDQEADRRRQGRFMEAMLAILAPAGKA